MMERLPTFLREVYYWNSTALPLPLLIVTEFFVVGYPEE